MITFLLLALLVLFVLAVSITLLLCGGGLFVIVFGDAIVFIFIMWAIFHKKKKKTE